MAEEQFTSRRARREAERLAAEQAFEAREVPGQSDEAQSSRADLLSPRPPRKPDAAPGPAADDGADSDSRIDPDPSPRTTHERGALASDHPLETRPPVHAEDRLDRQRSPLPHFESRAERKRYLREHGLSFNGDLSTGAIPVVADEEELAERRAAAEGRLTGPVTETAETAQSEDEHESYDAAGFGGDSDEVAARDFEAPVTAESAPRPTAFDDEPYDALSMPYSELEQEEAQDRSAGDASAQTPASESAEEATSASEAASSAAESDPNAVGTDSKAIGTDPDAAATDAKAAGTGSSPAETGPSPAGTDSGTPQVEGPTDDDAEASSRSRRMPIVQPPSTAGVRVVTAASAQGPEANAQEDRDSASQEGPSHADGSDTARDSGRAAESAEAKAPSAEAGSDDAARALAANPETRPMDAVPEAWPLPNPDYEDEETENPPGSRIRASSVTGQDGQILMGEEPSKMPYIILGVAAFFALALIVIALVMFL